MADKKINVMKKLILEKATINICVGNDPAGMVKANLLIRKLSKDKTPTKCCAKRWLATWSIRPGSPIGYKTTLRKEDAIEFLTWIFNSKGNKLNSKSIDNSGNFSVGIKEYLDLKGMKYDADIGIMGFEVMTTFIRPGQRVKRKALGTRIPKRHRPTKEEVVEYLKKNLKLEVI